jgi:4-diphosphocytidyl-2-C-methyl-D-erythritol kinase
VTGQGGVTAGGVPESELEELEAQAKLTLTLRVTGVRADGFHLLESEMVTLDLADSLFVGHGNALHVVTEFADDATRLAGTAATAESGAVPVGPDNLVARALAAVQRTARVDLVKRIPPGAGLGGGSADAAAILRWAGCTDIALAAGLGADVPFCLNGGRATVRGIGDELSPLAHEARRFVLLLLPFGVDTGAVYRAWDELAERDALPAAGTTSNDLEAAALLVEPRLAHWKACFEQAAGRTPHLAGSGSTWFIDGGPDESDIGNAPWLDMGDERGLLVPVSTTAPLR